MANVLVLGASGMLGSMVYDYFSRAGDHEVTGSVRQRARAEGIERSIVFDAERDDVSALAHHRFDFIVNCAGIIKPYCKDDDPVGVVTAIRINAEFPHRLRAMAEESGARVIQIATDCVFSGKRGMYRERDAHDPLDAYGKTKSLGEPFTGPFVNIRCSVVGPERDRYASLLEWFLHQPDAAVLKGFSHHRWNGITSLQFAQICHSIVSTGAAYFDSLIAVSRVHHYVPNTTVTKYELLRIFADVFGKKVSIEEVGTVGEPVDRTLDSDYGLLSSAKHARPVADAVRELREYLATAQRYGARF